MSKLGSRSSLNPSHISDATQVGVAAESPLDPAQIIYPPLVATGTEPYGGDTHTTVPTLPCQSQSGFEELLYVGPSSFVAAETQASSESYGPPGPSGFSQWGYVTNLTIATPTSDPSISTPSTQVLPTLRALSRPQLYPLSQVREVFAFSPVRCDDVGCNTAARVGVIRVGVMSCY